METLTSDQSLVIAMSPHQAYESVLAEIQAISIDALITISVDVKSAVAIMLAALPKIVPLRPRLEKLSEFDIHTVDSLPVLITALGYLDSKDMAATEPSGSSLPALAEECLKWHDLLFSYATAFTKSGLVDEARLGELRGTQGYRNLGYSLMALTSIHREVLPKQGDKSPFTVAQMEEADVLAWQLINGAAQKDGTLVVSDEVVMQRKQAFTLVSRRYNQLRRAVSYLRWDEGDADDFVPSVHSGKGTVKRNVAPTPEPTPEPAPPAPGPTPTPSPLATPAQNVPAGHPGSSPFV